MVDMSMRMLVEKHGKMIKRILVMIDIEAKLKAELGFVTKTGLNFSLIANLKQFFLKMYILEVKKNSCRKQDDFFS